ANTDVYAVSRLMQVNPGTAASEVRHGNWLLDNLSVAIEFRELFGRQLFAGLGEVLADFSQCSRFPSSPE
ncbi:hypothetical protein CPC16_008858, partial [Podila verticillata]